LLLTLNNEFRHFDSTSIFPLSLPVDIDCDRNYDGCGRGGRRTVSGVNAALAASVEDSITARYERAVATGIEDPVAARLYKTAARGAGLGVRTSDAICAYRPLCYARTVWRPGGLGNGKLRNCYTITIDSYVQHDVLLIGSVRI